MGKSSILCLLLLFYAWYAKGERVVLNITKDSLSITLHDGWYYHGGDNKDWAQPGTDDTTWETTNLLLGANNGHRLNFNNIGWFRLHLNIDSSLVGEQLALSVDQAGASEIYIDGKLLVSYGEIGNSHENSLYYNPQGKPATFAFNKAGEHVIAIRYAKYNMKETVDRYNNASLGAHIVLHRATVAINEYKGELLIFSAIFFPFFSLFVVLAFVHFLLWLYYRADRSNLFFSFFCLALSVSAAAIYLPNTASNPQLMIWGPNVAFVSFLLIFLSLSGLSNNLFSIKKTRFYVLCVLTGISIIITSIDPVFALNFVGVLMITMILESVIVTVKAIYKQQQPRVVAVGILFFTLFLLVTVSIFAIGIKPNLKDPDTRMVAVLLCVFAILATPVSMSVYLARSFATTNKNLKQQLVQVKELSERTMAQEREKKQILENQKERLEAEVKERTSEIVAEKQKSDDLLHNILPEEIAYELKERGATTAHHFDHVTVLFTDFVDFTAAGERMGSQALVEELHNCFKAFDEIMDKYKIEKIKTIGDAYMAVCGLPVANELHAEKAVQAAQDIRNFMIQRREKLGEKTFNIRIGIHSGEVVAGIVGVKKFAYDIWGDTVNTAARMESNSEPGKINISHTTYELVKDKFTCTYRGELEAKGKGKLKMYFVEA